MSTLCFVDPQTFLSTRWEQACVQYVVLMLNVRKCTITYLCKMWDPMEYLSNKIYFKIKTTSNNVIAIE